METTITRCKSPEISLPRAALVAGLAVLLMVLTVPFVEFHIFPALIDDQNAAQTIKNISSHSVLFSTAIFIHFMTVVCDVLVTWALYIFFKPVNRSLTLLAAWFRLVYTAFNVAAILNLIQVMASLRVSEHSGWMQGAHLNEYVLIQLQSFHLQWQLGLVFFGIYLCLLSCLAFRAKYVPKFIGVCILIAGVGYLIENLKHFFLP